MPTCQRRTKSLCYNFDMEKEAKKTNGHSHGSGVYHSKYKICVSGAAETGHCSESALESSEKLGRLIAEHNLVLVTGATTGAPYWAAKGAKKAGGFVVGLSPATTQQHHVEDYKLPVDYHDLIIYTGFDFSGRNLLLTRSSDAVITVCGRMGTLNEFTIAFEDNKPQGVLTGSGGMADMLEDIVNKAHRGPGKVVFDSDPERLLEKVIALIEEENKQNKKNEEKVKKAS